jgi:hypothetical protein
VELRCHVGTLGEYLLAVQKDGHINFNEVQIMKVKCDLCPTIEYGSVDKLAEKGWVRSVIISPARRTLTRCPKHRGTINSAIIDVLEGEPGEILEKNRIGTFEGGKIGDFKW